MLVSLLGVTSFMGRTGDVTLASVDFAGFSIGNFGTKGHALLDGLGNDDHTQYALANKSRPSPWVSAGDLAARSIADLGTKSHSLLDGLSGDGHPQYALADKTRPSPWVSASDLASRSLAELGTKSHASLDGLSADNHTQYGLLAGRSGGQTLNGGSGAGENLILRGNAAETNSLVRVDGTFAVKLAGSGTNNLLAVGDFRRSTPDTPAAGLGGCLNFQAETSTTEDIDTGRLVFKWANVTHATRQGEVSLDAADWAGYRTGLTVGADGTAAKIGFLGATAVVRQAVSGVRLGSIGLANLLSGLASLGLITNNSTLGRGVALTDAATVALDASLGDHFTLSGSTARTFGAPTNPQHDGQRIVIRVKNTGGAGITHTLTTGSAGAFRFPADYASLDAVAAGKINYFGAVYHATDDRWDVMKLPIGY